jgi:Fur family ferric uptake transcriptional regulator
MPQPIEQLKSTLKSAAYSLTTPRQVLFESLIGQAPLTMSQTIALCPNIDRASVYRTVSLFEQLGIIQKIQIGWKYKLELSDSFRSHHHHLSCIKCGRILDFKEDSQLETKIAEIAQDNSFRISSHQLEIQGYCTNCR